MLSKSQAKTFFWIGTGLCFIAFIGLSIDTFQRIPSQTHQGKLTPEAIQGKHLFDKNNCMGCHTILGEGAYYAPELTKVFERRGELFIRSVLKNPEAMFPGQRKMVNYHFTEEEITNLVQFLKWIGEMDLNGFPAKPDILPVGTSKANQSDIDSDITKKMPTVFKQTCTACHQVNGVGGVVGPALDDVGLRRDSNYISKWLRDPYSLKIDSKMPKLQLTDEQIKELTLFLSELKKGQ